ncbi:MAG: tyrosine-type recombinase/integrase [Hyphomicrobiaceae bacterium]
MPVLSSHPRSVASATADGGRRTKYTISDTPGLVLECTPAGEKTWYCRYHVGHGRKGRKARYHRLGVFDEKAPDHLTLGQAKDKANALRVKAKAGEDSFATERGIGSGAPFEKLFLQWLERHAKVHKKSWEADEGLYYRHIHERIGEKTSGTLKRRDIIEALDDIAAKVSGIQANRCHSLISAVCKWAQREDIIDDDPSHNIRKRGKENQRERVLTDDEAKRLWAALTDSPIDRAIKLLWLLGQRRAEVGRAGHNEIGSDDWFIPSERTKNKLAHIVPLTTLTRELFGGGLNVYLIGLSRRMRQLAADLEIEDFHLHDLRHCCATGMAALGVPRDIRERVQNQVTGRRLSIGARYDQYEYLDEKRRALELWQARLLEITEGREPSGKRWTG